MVPPQKGGFRRDSVEGTPRVPRHCRRGQALNPERDKLIRGPFPTWTRGQRNSCYTAVTRPSMHEQPLRAANQSRLDWSALPCNTHRPGRADVRERERINMGTWDTL